ncbi:MAG TPA: ABC transporter permease, partial [Vicinamibacterales bacterium]|nr:ABC transporter permease [Vicinamibacterales bacterium]
MTTRNLSLACRSLARMPVLAAVVIASLAVGIGVNTAVFSWVQAMILRPLPGVPDTGRMHLVEPRTETGTYPGSSWLEYRDLRERVRSIPDLIAFRMVAFNVGEAPRVERTYGLLVSDNYFSALRLRPALGRFLRSDEGVRPD